MKNDKIGTKKIKVFNKKAAYILVSQRHKNDYLVIRQLFMHSDSDNCKRD